MTKDYLKFRNSIKKDENLSLEEGYMLELIFDYYNTSCGYAYPSYETLMSDLKTKRKAKVSKLLKSLVKKGYISITKVGKKNTYKLLKYLSLNNPVDSNGKPPIDGQIHYTDITDEEKEVIELGFTQKQAKSLLQVAKDKVDKIVKAFNYAKEKGADNIYSYTLWAINNISKIKNILKPVDNENWNPKTKFDNFEPRQYNWDSLEERLLGWDA
ncbi:helix-turn-helix transcriptional regulator [Candidatus Clostridium helianthi]|uniref:Helix-turn-helix transcriptional regulator n=1 Tax=Candidatus Clostridium helianthi TaxID=3381660 RepID=A0ABW8S4D9_9CLOT